MQYNEGVCWRERIGEEEGEKEGSQGKGGWEERKRECG